MNEKWFAKIRDNEIGPIPFETLERLIRKNQANVTTPVRRESGGPWMPLERALKRTPAPLASAAKPVTLPSSTGRRLTSGLSMLLTAIVVIVVASVVLMKLNGPSALKDVAESGLTEPAPQAPPPVQPVPPRTTTPNPPTEVSPPLAAATVEGLPQPLPQGDPDAAPIEVLVADDDTSEIADLSDGSGSAADGSGGTLESTPDVLEQGSTSSTSEERAKVTDLQISRFQDQVSRERDPDIGVARYVKFMSEHRVTPSQHSKLSVELVKWKERVAKGQVRLGLRWVSPGEEQAAKKAGEELLKQADVLLGLHNLKDAVKVLERASTADPNAIEADFIIGLIDSVVFVDPRKSQQRFTQVLKRYPDHISALNNLAVSEIKVREYRQALKHLARCSELAPRCPEVLQNLGRLSYLCGQKVIAVPEKEKRQCNELYARLVANGQAKECDTRRGWSLMPLLLPGDKRKLENPASASGDLVLFAYGTGFAVQPDLVLTNRHVVAGDESGLGTADEVRITIDSPSGSKVVPGQVLALADGPDLALVRFPNLGARPLSLRNSSARTGEEIAILGYPTPDEAGCDLKFVRGDVASATGDRLLLNAVANQGNSGGPVVVIGGDVVGVYSFVLKVGDAVRTQYGGGVPIERTVRFVREHVPGYGSPTTSSEPDWPATVEELKPSVFKLDVYYSAGSLAFMTDSSRNRSRQSYIEDRTCPRCCGRMTLSCPAPQCNKGAVKVFWTEIEPQRQLNDEIRMIPVPYWRTEPCGVCDGIGMLDCPRCDLGVDSELQ